jgi:deazaflavin-dependent oxidoreductase (nitroreductase family)
MPVKERLWDMTGGALLMRSGRAGRLTTTGRKSGKPRTVQCGYLARADGTLIVGSVKDREWPLNLRAAGWCLFEARGLPARRYGATQLEGHALHAAIEELRAARGERMAQMASDVVFVLTPTESG